MVEVRYKYETDVTGGRRLGT